MKRLRLLSAVFVLIALIGNSNSMKFVAVGEDEIKGDKVINRNRRYS